MELALTFGAVGDLIALAALIKDIIVCLDDCRGSSREYQGLVQSLTVLESALQEADLIFRDPRRLSTARRLCETALKSIQQIQSTLTAFSDKIQKYRSSLGAGGSGNRLKDVARKIQFKLDEKDVAKFKGDVAAYTVALKMLIEVMTLHSLEQNHEEVTKSLTSISSEAQQTRSGLETTSQMLMSCVTGVGRQVIEKIAFLTQTTLDIKQSVSQIASTVISLSLKLSSFRLLLMSFQRDSVDQYYFTVEDAVGRTFPVHLNTITSWEAFAFVLSEKFKGVRGARRVRDRRYRLIEHATRREIDQSNNWSRAFLPRQKIVMSLLCKDADNNSSASTTGPLATCPWCKTESDSDTSAQVQCRNCNMFFTRVVELDDVVLPSQPSKPRGAPQFGQPSFNVQLPPGWMKGGKRKRMGGGGDTGGAAKGTRYQAPRGRNLKRSHHEESDDSDAEPDDEDVNGLVRVTVVSRRKRIKVFHLPPQPLDRASPSPGVSAFRASSFKSAPTLEPAATGSVFALSKQGEVGVKEPNADSFQSRKHPEFGSATDGAALPSVSQEKEGERAKVDDDQPSRHLPPMLDQSPYHTLLESARERWAQIDRNHDRNKPKLDEAATASNAVNRLVDADENADESEASGPSEVAEGGNSAQDTILAGRYRLVPGGCLGCSKSDPVVEARDITREKRVAIKIVYPRDRWRDTWHIESSMLNAIRKNDPWNKHRCLRPVIDLFDIGSDRFLVADIHGKSIFHLRNLPTAPPLVLDLNQIKSIALQLFSTVAYLHDSNIAHTNINTETIVLMDDGCDEVIPPEMWYFPKVSKLTPRGNFHQLHRVLRDTTVRVKLGSAAVLTDPTHWAALMAKLCRAPGALLDALLDIERDFRPGDIWNVGCVLLELLTDEVLFKPVDDREHLAIMENICNAKVVDSYLVTSVYTIQQALAERNYQPSTCFFNDGKLRYPLPDTPPGRLEYVESIKRLDEIIPQKAGPSFDQFLDLLKKIFVFNPDKRITAKEALAHPWLQEAVLTRGTGT